jgi:hypothetical protein
MRAPLSHEAPKNDDYNTSIITRARSYNSSNTAQMVVACLWSMGHENEECVFEHTSYDMHKE